MEENKSYLECKKCFYKCNKKKDMLKHLNKKKPCIRILESYKYKDEELYELSLVRENKVLKSSICDKCNKNFYNSSNLKRHLEKKCNKEIKDIYEGCFLIPNERKTYANVFCNGNWKVFTEFLKSYSKFSRLIA